MNIISSVLNTSLNYFFSLTGDWGIAIVLLTILVRTLLLPMSMKQKLSMQQQQSLSKKIEELKEKYKNNKEKLESELQKHYQQSAKSMFGCLVSLLQLPIIFTLYSVILKMPVHAGTIIIPWVTSIKLADSYFVLPILYALTTLSPNLLSYFSFLKVSSYNNMPKSTLILTSIFSVLITIKIPIAVGIYLITTSLFSLMEEIAFRLYLKNRSLSY